MLPDSSPHTTKGSQAHDGFGLKFLEEAEFHALVVGMPR